VAILIRALGQRTRASGTKAASSGLIVGSPPSSENRAGLSRVDQGRIQDLASESVTRPL
jgi:hypothetical protein